MSFGWRTQLNMRPWLSWIERLATDQKVGGSNPSGRAEIFGFRLRVSWKRSSLFLFVFESLQAGANESVRRYALTMCKTNALQARINFAYAMSCLAFYFPALVYCGTCFWSAIVAAHVRLFPTWRSVFCLTNHFSIHSHTCICLPKTIYPYQLQRLYRIAFLLKW